VITLKTRDQHEAQDEIQALYDGHLSLGEWFQLSGWTTDSELSQLSGCTTDSELSQLSGWTTDSEQSQLSGWTTDSEWSQLSDWTADSEWSQLSDWTTDSEWSQLLEWTTDNELSQLLEWTTDSEDEGTTFFETLGTTLPPTHFHMPGDLNPNCTTVRTSNVTGSGLYLVVCCSVDQAGSTGRHDSCT
jgi:hypothetical protein